VSRGGGWHGLALDAITQPDAFQKVKRAFGNQHARRLSVYTPGSSPDKESNLKQSQALPKVVSDHLIGGVLNMPDEYTSPKTDVATNLMLNRNTLSKINSTYQRPTLNDIFQPSSPIDFSMSGLDQSANTQSTTLSDLFKPMDSPASVTCSMGTSLEEPLVSRKGRKLSKISDEFIESDGDIVRSSSRIITMSRSITSRFAKALATEDTILPEPPRSPTSSPSAAMERQISLLDPSSFGTPPSKV
jgi:hypothetical protein